MRSRLRLIAFVSFLLPAPAMAEQWRELSLHPDQASILVDLDSLRWSDDLATFWARLMPVQATPNSDESPPLSPYLVELACATKQVRLSSSSGVNGANPFAPQDLSPYTFQPTAGMVASTLRAKVCNLNPKLLQAITPARNLSVDQENTERETNRALRYRPPAFPADRQ